MAIKTYGVVAYFDSPAAITDAAKKTAAKGYKNWETYTPFPIHGMDDIQGLKPSIVPWATLIGGLTGFSAAVGLQVWTSAIDWPINVGGRPMFSIPAFIPIMFELTVLLGGLSTAGFMFFLNRLPITNPHPFDPRITDDKFALYIPLASQTAAQGDIESFLKSLSAEKVSIVTEPV